MIFLKYFDLYAAKGMRVIPVYRQSKIPVGNGWNKKWDKRAARNAISTGQYNMGLLLGEYVDVEGDDEESNRILVDLIDGLPHPMYRSSRSIHHLFRNPDPNLTALRVGGIEFRGHGVQSVLPPSIHEDGTSYCWLKGSVFPAPLMPDRLYEFYKENRNLPEKKAKRPAIRRGFIKTECKMCRGPEMIHRKRLALEVKVFSAYGLKWHCQKCRRREGMEYIDLKNSCRTVRNYKFQD